MIEYENECVGCPKEMGCFGSTCPMVNVPHIYCDKCGDEMYYDEVYSDESYEHLCESCLLLLHKVGDVLS